jgi:hypothetical protein
VFPRSGAVIDDLIKDINNIVVLVVSLSLMEGVVKPFLSRLGRDKYNKLDQLLGDRLPNHPSRINEDRILNEMADKALAESGELVEVSWDDIWEDVSSRNFDQKM